MYSALFMFQLLTEGTTKRLDMVFWNNTDPTSFAIFSPFSQHDESPAILPFVIHAVQPDLCFDLAVSMEFPLSESKQLREF
jgi:hypothetical protein